MQVAKSGPAKMQRAGKIRKNDLVRNEDTRTVAEQKLWVKPMKMGTEASDVYLVRFVCNPG
jgi:hypothetical protein